MEEAKRNADDAGLEPPSIAAKQARLEDDEVAKATTGVNVIEIDGKSCTHEVAWPPGQEGCTLPPARRDTPAAKQYPFKLDPFQQTAIDALEAGQCSFRAGSASSSHQHHRTPPRTLRAGGSPHIRRKDSGRRVLLCHGPQVIHGPLSSLRLQLRRVLSPPLRTTAIEGSIRTAGSAPACTMLQRTQPLVN
jgi:hypothetical protein